MQMDVNKVIAEVGLKSGKIRKMVKVHCGKMNEPGGPKHFLLVPFGPGLDKLRKAMAENAKKRRKERMDGRGKLKRKRSRGWLWRAADERMGNCARRSLLRGNRGVCTFRVQRTQSGLRESLCAG